MSFMDEFLRRLSWESGYFGSATFHNSGSLPTRYCSINQVPVLGVGSPSDGAADDLSFNLVSAIPKPSTFAGFFGLTALGIAACSRRLRRVGRHRRDVVLHCLQVGIVKRSLLPLAVHLARHVEPSLRADQSKGLSGLAIRPPQGRGGEHSDNSEKRAEYKFDPVFR